MRGNVVVGFIVLFIIFVPLERMFALRKEQKVFRAGWGTDVAHFLVNRFLVQVGLLMTAGSLMVLLRWTISAGFQAAVAAQPGWLQFAEAVFIADLGGYIGHRMAHHIPWLWRFHAIHHSSEQMDWLAAARLHPFDQMFIRTLQFIPLYVLGFTRVTFGFYLALAAFQALFIHANVRFRFGPLRWVLATPEFHHWHHAADVEAINKNFAGQCPLLDLVFGTLYLPPGRMPKKYGTTDPIPSGYLKQMIFPFRRQPETSSLALP